MNRGAIILCGGKSSRMGRDKATLPFGPERMLERVIRLLSAVVPVERMVVVAAAGQELPELPAEIAVARDDRPERGPLEGLAAGLRAQVGKSDAVYVTACDVPLLVPAFVERMFELLGARAIAVPQGAEFHHPLAAVYRTSVLELAERLLAADRLRLRYLFDESDTVEVPIEELRAVDPELSTLENLNHPEDYERALRAAGFARDHGPSM
jgi:molybdopterin-guanine dinucleotide biosynthesis protein A